MRAALRNGAEPAPLSPAPGSDWEDAMTRYVSMSIRLASFVLLAALIGGAPGAGPELSDAGR